MRVGGRSAAQDAHLDAGGRDAPRVYLTLLVPLNHHPGSGGTEFPGHPELDGRVLSPLGGAVAFGGRVLHRGAANDSQEDRLFLYAAVHTGGDPNC